MLRRAVPLDSHFCCTLVIEPPPGSSQTPQQEGQLQACWGMPDQSHLPGENVQTASLTCLLLAAAETMGLLL